MKFSKLFLMSAAIVLFAAGACNKETDDSGNGGTDGGATATPEIVVDLDEVSVSYEGGEVTVSYSVTNTVEGESLTADVDADWVSAVVGDETITLTVEANEVAESRSATVTLSYPGASDEVISVVQEAWIVSYESFIGTWTGTDVNGTPVNIKISQNVESESYTVSGWQFGGEYTDFSEFGFEPGGSLDFTSTYDSENQVLAFNSVSFGEFSNDITGSTVNGNIYLYGKVLFYGSELLITTSGDPYTMATMSLTDANNAEITPETLTMTGAGDHDYVTMKYIFTDTVGRSERSGYFPTTYGTYFPITLTRASE